MGPLASAPRYAAAALYSSVSMRMYELSPAECEEILLRSDLCRLACAREEQPYIVPIHFSFDAARKCLYAFSTVGQKIDWMRQNPKVCVEVDDVADKNHWTTVLAFGRYEELGDSAAEKAARNSAQQLFSKRPEWWLPAAAKVGPREHHAMVIYRIQIDRMTGRRASRDRV
jgi:nitroimidazol reductase NimA-like FMN-containing flavoprotein (pyridoxamine 5'-phosphate oxidase superfamily)